MVLLSFALMTVCIRADEPGWHWIPSPDGGRVLQPPTKGFVVSVAWSPDGSHFLSGGGYDVQQWDTTTGNNSWNGHGHSDSGSVTAVAYSPDGSRIVSGNFDETLRIWDAATGKSLLELVGSNHGPYTVQYSPDGAHIVSSGGHTKLPYPGPDGDHIRDIAIIWDAVTGDLLHKLIGHYCDEPWCSDSGCEPCIDSAVMSAAYSPDGAHVVTASLDMKIIIWDATTGKLLLTLKGHTRCVYGAAYSPDGTRIVSAGGDRKIIIWDAVTGKPLQIIDAPQYEGHMGHLNSVQYSPDGAHIVSASDDGTVGIWDATTGMRLQVGSTCEMSKYSSTCRVVTAVYSPDGGFILSGGDDQMLRIWNVSAGVAALPTQQILI